jgi:hypothetical protein
MQGGVAPSPGGGVMAASLPWRSGAGLEKATQFTGGEVAAAAFGLPPHGGDAGRRLVLLDRHQLRVPAFP